jgi:hypothetical protein
MASERNLFPAAKKCREFSGRFEATKNIYMVPMLGRMGVLSKMLEENQHVIKSFLTLTQVLNNKEAQ